MEMVNGVHCVSLTDWWLKDYDNNKRLKTIPYTEQTESVCYNVIDRCIMEDCLYETVRKQMTPGSILPECVDYVDGKTVCGVMLSGISSQDSQLSTAFHPSLQLNMESLIKDILALGDCQTINENDYLSTISPSSPLLSTVDTDFDFDSCNPAISIENCKIRKKSSLSSVVDTDFDFDSCNPIISIKNCKIRRKRVRKCKTQHSGKGHMVFSNVFSMEESEMESLITATALAEYYSSISDKAGFYRFKRLKENRERLQTFKNTFCNKYGVKPGVSCETLKKILMKYGKTFIFLDNDDDYFIHNEKSDILILINKVNGRWFSGTPALIRIV